MDEHTHHDLIDNIRIVSLRVEGVDNTEKCHIRKVGTKYHVDLHVWVDGSITVSDGHSISGKVKELLMKEIKEIDKVLIHIEPA